MKRRDKTYTASVPYRPFFRPISYWWRYRFTTAGKCMFVGLILSGGMGGGSLQAHAFQLFATILAVCAITWIAGWMFRSRLAVTGSLPDKASAGQTVTGEFTLTNVSRRRLYDFSAAFFRLPSSLREGESEDAIQEVLPGKSAVVPIRIQALKRGHYVLPRLHAFTSFPFHLLRTPLKSDAQESKLLVLPAFHRAGEINVPLGRRYQPGGVALTSSIGESPEYIGNREYRPGDPMRRIDHKSWGRIGKPVVREYQEEYYCRIALILDTFAPSAMGPLLNGGSLGARLRNGLRSLTAGRRREAPPEGYPELEAAISLSASVADALSRGEYLIDIFAAGPELYVFRSGRHTAHFENILEILSCIDACRANPFDTLGPALMDELHSISTAICVFLDWDKTRQEFVRSIAEAGCSVKVYVVREGGAAKTAGWEMPEEGMSVYAPSEIMSGGIENL